MRSPSLSFPILLLAAVATVAPVRCQCDAHFQPGDPAGAPRGEGFAMQVFDPDGSGPLLPELVIGGALHDDAGASTVFAYDGTRWRALGSPPAGRCLALGVFNGELIAAIADAVVSPTRTDVVAWNGTTWRQLGTTPGRASCMTVFNGRLAVGGTFATFSGLPAANVVQWDGASWSALGSGISGSVNALAVYAGLLWVGGNIIQAGGAPMSNLVTWNGQAWAAGASINGPVLAMTVRQSPTVATSFLFVGGSFNQVGTLGTGHVARFNQQNGWVALPGFPSWQPPGGCQSLVTRGTGLTFEVVAGALDPPPHTYPYVWNGSTWIGLGTGRPDTSALAVFGGRYVALEKTGTVRTLDATSTWVGLGGPGIDGPVMAVAATATDVVIGGSFSSISGVTMNGVARGSVGAWQPLGNGVTGGTVNAVAVMPNGDVVAAGTFDSAGGTPARRIARWNGSAWAPLGPGLGVAGTSFPPETVSALAVLPDGSLVAGGRFQGAGNLLVNHVARWDGTAWTAMASGFPDSVGQRSEVFCLALRPDGELVAGGFLLPGRVLARWNGSSWAPMPAEPNGTVASLATLANGDMLVGGSFGAVGTQQSPHLARWTGSAWIAVPGLTHASFDYVPMSLVPLPDGGALVSGLIRNTTNPRFARYDGQAVIALPDPGTTFASGTRAGNGDVFFVGDFLRPGNVLSAYVTRYVSPCPAVADRYGAGCTGSGGLGDLRATRLPVLGTTFAARATGMPVFGLAFAVTGFAPTSIPLQSLLPQGLPGCNLLATADTIDFRPLANGSAQSSLSVPASAPLIGMVIHHQFVVFELAGVNVVAATSTNGLRLRLGVF